MGKLVAIQPTAAMDGGFLHAEKARQWRGFAAIDKFHGPATIRKLRAIEPDVPVILLTGCAPEEAQERCRGLQLAGVMQKPFNLGQLGALVAKVVENRARGVSQAVALSS